MHSAIPSVPLDVSDAQVALLRTLLPLAALQPEEVEILRNREFN